MIAGRLLVGAPILIYLVAISGKPDVKGARREQGAIILQHTF